MSDKKREMAEDRKTKGKMIDILEKKINDAIIKIRELENKE